MWSNPLETADLVTFTEQILYEKLHFFFSAFIGYNFFNLEDSKSLLGNMYNKTLTFY